MAHEAAGEMAPYPRKDTSEQGRVSESKLQRQFDALSAPYSPKRAACQHRTLERVTRCPDCGVVGPDLEDVFADGPPLGIGPDGQTHSDPWCAMIAPIGSPEYRRGELCELCIEREDASDTGGNAEANAYLIAAAPDLLAALEALYTVVGEGMIDGEYVLRPQLTAAHDAARAAIEKAHGDA